MKLSKKLVYSLLCLSVPNAVACGDENGAGQGRARLVRISPLGAGEICPNGGQLIAQGADANGNGALDEAEIEEEEPACGSSPSGVVLVETTQLDAGDAACPEGGLEVKTGMDVDADGVLDDAEAHVAFVCNGAGKDGADGADGMDGKDGVDGKDGHDGEDGVDGKDGHDGEDGVDGNDGLDGEDGADGTDGMDGKDGVDGKDGLDGEDGVDGKDGLDGEDGLDGRDGADGKDGIDGKDGADGRDGLDGQDGLDGKDGMDGKDGLDGKDGADALATRSVTKPEPAGWNCGRGGVVIETGVDLDGNGLDPAEVTERSYVCAPYLRRVFVTAGSFTGDLGGLTGADEKCQQAANAMPSLAGYPFKAWLSSKDQPVAKRFTRDSALGFVRVDGTKIAESWEDLTDGTLLSVIDLTDTGSTSGRRFWSSSTSSGAFAGELTCDDWSSTTGSGYLGEADRTDSSWAGPGDSGARSAECHRSFGILCIEQ